MRALPYSSLFLYFLHLKDKNKITIFILKSLDLYPIKSINDLLPLKEIIVECIKLHDTAFAFNLIACIASKLNFPVFALIAILAPQLIPEALGQQHLLNMMNSQDFERPVFPSLKDHSFMVEIPTPAGCENLVFKINLRACLYVLHENPDVKINLKEFLSSYLSFPDANVVRDLEIILAALPNHDKESFQFLFDTLLEHFHRIEKNAYATKVLNSAVLFQRGIYRRGTAGADLFNALVLDCAETTDLCAKTITFGNFWFLSAQIYKRLIEKAAASNRPPFGIFNVFISHFVQAQVPPDENFKEILQEFFKYPELIEHILFHIFEKLISHPSERIVEVIKLLLNHTNYSAEDANLKLQQINRLINEKHAQAHHGRNERNIPITHLIQREEIVLVAMVKKGGNYRDGNTLSLSKYLSEDGFRELFQHIRADLTDDELLTLTMNCLPENDNHFALILDEIGKRAQKEELMSSLCASAIKVRNTDLFNPFLLNEKLFNLLVNCSAVSLRGDIIEKMNSIIRSFPCKLENVNTNLHYLLILSTAGLNLEPLFDEESVYRLFKIGKGGLARFAFLEVLKKLSLAEANRIPFSPKSKAAQLFAENVTDLYRKAGPGRTTRMLYGYQYDFTVTPDNTIHIHFNKEGSSEFKRLFYGYITYEKMLEMIREHSLATRHHEVVRIIRTGYSSAIVDLNATIEVQGLIEQNKNSAIKIDEQKEKIYVHLLKPGLMQIAIHEFTFDQFHQKPTVIDDLLQEWTNQVFYKTQKLLEQYGDRCFYDLPSNLDLFGIQMNVRTGQVAFVEVLGNGVRRTSFMPIDTLKLRFEDSHNDLVHITELQLWAISRQGQAIRGKANQLSEYTNSSSILRHYFNKATWFCLPWVNQRAWLFAMDMISGWFLTIPLAKTQERQQKLDNLLELQKILGGFIPDVDMLNGLVKPAQIKKHTTSAPIDLNVLLIHFEKLKKEPWFLKIIDKEKIPVETLESNLNHFITCAKAKSGIIGWEDTVKHEANYLDLLIYITNTLDALLKNKEEENLPLDKQSLTSLVLELAKHGRFCGTKLSEICYSHYALAYKIENAELAGDNLDEVISVAYKQACLETLDTLVQFLGDPEAQSQSIHVMSYLRATLAAKGYTVPHDPRIPPNMQNGADDEHHTVWGQNDYPPDTLNTIFPAICMPLFLLKLNQALIEMKNKGQWESIVHMKKMLFRQDRDGIGRNN